MGLNFNIIVGSGKATCKICQEKIKTSQFQINAQGYQTSGSIHLKCANDIANKTFKDKNIRKKMILNSIQGNDIMVCPTGRTSEQLEIIELKAKLKRYVKAYNILMDKWDCIPEEERQEVSDQLDKVDL